MTLVPWSRCWAISHQLTGDLIQPLGSQLLPLLHHQSVSFLFLRDCAFFIWQRSVSRLYAPCITSDRGLGLVTQKHVYLGLKEFIVLAGRQTGEQWVYTKCAMIWGSRMMKHKKGNGHSNKGMMRKGFKDTSKRVVVKKKKSSSVVQWVLGNMKWGFQALWQNRIM